MFLPAIAFLALIIWLFLLLFWGRFWLADRKLEPQIDPLESYPSVCAIVPARNEAEVLPITLRSLLNQDYIGNFSVVLVDDQSTDDTAAVAQKTARQLSQTTRFNLISGQQLPSGWTGKLWAMKQGIDRAREQGSPDYFLFTDADIKHDLSNLSQLVSKAQTQKCDLVSLMVLLRCHSFWEKFLIPAFIFFFQKLYPFPWVNNPQSKIAAAAGGCILISSQALERIGGITVIKDALIDDCALAKAVKSDKSASIWLGLTDSTYSLRPYDSLRSIWNIVARTAFTQLRYSPWLLLGTLLGMSLVYLVAPITLIVGILTANWLLTLISLLTWLLMSIAYLPTIRLYSLSWWWAFSLPAIAFLYTLMTLDSAIRHYRGQGGAWKGRVYQPSKINREMQSSTSSPSK